MRLPAVPSVPAWLRDPKAGALVTAASFGTITAALAPLLGEEELVAVAMLFLLGVLLSSAIWGYAVGLFGALLADVLLNVFFVPPVHGLTVQEPRHVAALMVFLAVSAVGSFMLALFRRQLRVAEERREELTVMLHLSRQLAAAPTPERALDSLCHSVISAVRANRCEILQLTGRTWQVLASTGPAREISRDEGALAQKATETGQLTRRLSAGRPGRAVSLKVHRPQTVSLFVPFSPPSGGPGVIHIAGAEPEAGGSDVDALLRAFADEASVAIHRAGLAEQAREAEALRQSDEFKSVLLSSVSHDLRSPLTAIKAAVGGLRSDTGTWTEADRARLLETIESQTDRLTATVTDLLQMSRLEGGAIRPTLEPVEVRALLQDAIEACRPATGHRDVCCDTTEETWVRADYGLLLQSLTNLIDNAAKYSTPGEPIHLRVRETPGRVLLEVADSGPGISGADLPHIFERFYRGGEGRRTQGTGLGLSIVRAMLELCGGSVTVDSSPAGTTFIISLPAMRRPR